LTPSDSQSSAKSAQKPDNDWEWILSECSRLASNWDRAEKWVKRAELFQQRVVDSSLNELRYAGRRLVDALAGADKEDFPAASVHLEQANENIYKASHDAIDTVVAFVSQEINRHAIALGYANLNDHFGHYQELSGAFTTIKGQIEQSRESREQRDEVYNEIAEGADFVNLLKYFNELRGSAPAIYASVEKKTKESRNLSARWWIGIGVGAAGVTATAVLLALRFLGI